MRTKTITRTLIGGATLSVLIGVPALAAPRSAPSGSIELMQPVAALSAPGEVGSSSTPPPLTYDGNAEFVTTVEGNVSSKGYVYVTLVCWQAGTVVYQYSAAPDFAFPLHDQLGQGLEWNPTADASCEAWLIYRVDKGRSSDITVLGTETFDVSAKLTA